MSLRRTIWQIWKFGPMTYLWGCKVCYWPSGQCRCEGYLKTALPKEWQFCALRAFSSTGDRKS